MKLMYLMISFLDDILWLIQKVYHKLKGRSGYCYLTLFNSRR